MDELVRDDREMMEESTGPFAVVSDTQSNQSILRDYEISIRFLSVGCIVKVGCKEIPFTNTIDAMNDINEYIKNPRKERERWFEIFNSVE